MPSSTPTTLEYHFGSRSDHVRMAQRLSSHHYLLFLQSSSTTSIFSSLSTHPLRLLQPPSLCVAIVELNGSNYHHMLEQKFLRRCHRFLLLPLLSLSLPPSEQGFKHPCELFGACSNVPDHQQPHHPLLLFLHADSSPSRTPCNKRKCRRMRRPFTTRHSS